MTSVKDTATKLKNWQPDPNITPEALAEMRKEVLDKVKCFNEFINLFGKNVTKEKQPKIMEF